MGLVQADLLMVTMAGEPRRSLRRLMANMTPVTPKATCQCDAFLLPSTQETPTVEGLAIRSATRDTTRAGG
jgi:hypothetical protein